MRAILGVVVVDAIVADLADAAAPAIAAETIAATATTTTAMLINIRTCFAKQAGTQNPLSSSGCCHVHNLDKHVDKHGYGQVCASAYITHSDASDCMF